MTTVQYCRFTVQPSKNIHPQGNHSDWSKALQEIVIVNRVKKKNLATTYNWAQGGNTNSSSSSNEGNTTNKTKFSNEKVKKQKNKHIQTVNMEQHSRWNWKTKTSCQPSRDNKVKHGNYIFITWVRTLILTFIYNKWKEKMLCGSEIHEPLGLRIKVQWLVSNI